MSKQSEPKPKRAKRPRRLSGKQALFVMNYLDEARFNAVEAARLSGYKNPESSAQDNMAADAPTFQAIKRKLDSLIPSPEELAVELASLAMSRPGDKRYDPRTKAKAISDLLKLHGRLIERKEVRVDVHVIGELLGMDPGKLGLAAEGDE